MVLSLYLVKSLDKVVITVILPSQLLLAPIVLLISSKVVSLSNHTLKS